MLILKGKLKCVDRLAFSPDGARLAAAGGANNPVEVFAFAAPTAPPLVVPVRLDVNQYEFAFDPAGEVLVVADDCDVVGFDAGTAAELWRVLPEESFVLAGIDVAADGRLALGFLYQYLSDDGYQVWRLAGRAEPTRVRATAGSPEVGCTAVRFVKGGAAAAFAEYDHDSHTFQFYLLPVAGRKRGRLIESELGEVLQLAVSADGTKLAALARRAVWVWDVDSPAAPPAKVAVKGRKAMTGVAFHPSGRSLAVTSNDATVTLFDTQSWDVAKTLTWNVGRLRAVAFSADGLRAAVGSDTGQIVVWDVDG